MQPSGYNITSYRNKHLDHYQSSETEIETSFSNRNANDSCYWKTIDSETNRFCFGFWRTMGFGANAAVLDHERPPKTQTAIATENLGEDACFVGALPRWIQSDPSEKILGALPLVCRSERRVPTLLVWKPDHRRFF